MIVSRVVHYTPTPRLPSPRPCRRFDSLSEDDKRRIRHRRHHRKARAGGEGGREGMQMSGYQAVTDIRVLFMRGMRATTLPCVL